MRVCVTLCVCKVRAYTCVPLSVNFFKMEGFGDVFTVDDYRLSVLYPVYTPRTRDRTMHDGRGGGGGGGGKCGVKGEGRGRMG